VCSVVSMVRRPSSVVPCSRSSRFQCWLDSAANTADGFAESAECLDQQHQTHHTIQHPTFNIQHTNIVGTDNVDRKPFL